MLQLDKGNQRGRNREKRYRKKKATYRELRAQPQDKAPPSKPLLGSIVPLDYTSTGETVEVRKEIEKGKSKLRKSYLCELRNRANMANKSNVLMIYDKRKRKVEFHIARGGDTERKKKSSNLKTLSSRVLILKLIYLKNE
ncbi:hypothetical protein KY284_023066 [Solanum tuberosum]|nr:hypothetical protein KY284_023066 [Solanum tuberosum]